MAGVKEHHIYVGFDPKEGEAFEVCVASAMRHSRGTSRIHPLIQSELREVGIYSRTWHRDETGQRIDDSDGRPFSTDFTFTRFLVPAIHRRSQRKEKWALFCDSDFLFRTDPREVFQYADPRYALMCVKHNHHPTETTKMSGQAQTAYPRKNWSSLILWNTQHDANTFTIDDVSVRSGRWLHGFSWLPDELIGALPEEWNWLEGSSDPGITPKAVHYTRGVPTHEGMKDAPYADEWRGYLSGCGRPADGSRAG